ncbi:MAG: dihydroorotate dehydrogenase family protein [Symbiobacteriaceae bacterium]|jgi:dihydroorotate dehydrogenase/NAD-dependent dihydropyrimidine dehydrogenase PreA subunit|nr:dihydroorotate dehydrogenase family protein [Symbiobacteriaceae bacterium]
MANLAVELTGLRFPNPILAGAGPSTEGAAALAAAARGGAGGLVARTVLAHPFLPAAEPSVVPYGRDGLLTNQRGSSLTAADWTYPQDLSIPVIASLAGTAAEVLELGPRLVASGAQALEFATAFLGWPESVEALQALRKAVNVPIWAKLSLRHGEDIADRAAQIEPFVDAFVCMSGFGPVLDIDVDAGGAPRLSDPYGYGWLSGAPIHPIAVRTVFEVARRVNKPVIASGGAMTARDVVEFLQVGAVAVQVTTLPMLKGPQAYEALTNDLNGWLDQHGYDSVADITNLYLNKWRHGQRVVLITEEAPKLDKALCTGCTICGLVCYWDAITAKPKALPIINADNCFECGLCVSACPEGALSFRPRTEVTLLP